MIISHDLTALYERLSHDNELQGESNSIYEQETIVNYNAGEQTATVYTRDKAVMRKPDTLVADFPSIYKLIKQTDNDKTYSMPKSYISYRKPRKLSNEQREQARQRIAKILNV